MCTWRPKNSSYIFIFKRYSKPQFLLKYKEMYKDINSYVFEDYSNSCYFNVNSGFWWRMTDSAWKGVQGLLQGCASLRSLNLQWGHSVKAGELSEDVDICLRFFTSWNYVVYLVRMRGTKRTFHLQWTVMANWTCASGLSISVLGKVLATEMAMWPKPGQSEGFLEITLIFDDWKNLLLSGGVSKPSVAVFLPPS